MPSDLSPSLRTETAFHDAGLTAKAYARRFPEIGVTLDWERFEAERWPVRRWTLRQREQLLALRSAFWTRFGRFNPRFLKTIGTRSIWIAEAVGQLDAFPDKDRELILSIAETFRSAGKVRLDVPAYALTDGTVLVLDANHRLTALALADVPFQVELFLVQGPSDFKFYGMHFKEPGRG